ncbi:PAS domain S-box protein [Roseomonas cutis]|uniref:PAS domain S-box protein n=1 Tax=Roseomonas cutis TaxID=2897332 RepID=UPI002102A2A4|nr:PAS domain S-box protein [Roseomonas sp. OT10]
MPWTEPERLAALHRTGLTGTAPDAELDAQLRLVAELLDMPLAALLLVAADRIWSRASFGPGAAALAADPRLARAALHRADGLVVPDLRAAGATSGPRFWAAMPVLSEGMPVGVLCVADTRPHPGGLAERQGRLLANLADQMGLRVALRRATAQQDALPAEAAEDGSLQQQTIDSAIDLAIISTSLDGRIKGWNSGASGVFGWTEAEMLNRPFESLFSEEERAAGTPAAEMRTALRDGRSTDERWQRRKDGNRFWASGELMPLRDAQGRHIGFLKVLRDRTRQHLEGEAVAALNERYRLAQRATRDAIWDWDLRNNFVRWNEALESAFGWPSDTVEPSGRWWLQQIHPDDRDGVDRGIHDVIDGAGTSWTDEYRFRRADGSYAHVLDRGYLIRDPAGQPLRMIGAMLDQTAQRRADAALRDREDRLRLATTGARIGTFDYRVRRDDLTWDDRCRELFGVPPGAPVSYAGTFLAGLHPEDRAMADAAVRQALDPGGSGRFACEYRTIGLTDGIERWVSANGEALFEHGEPVRLIGTVLDITDRKRADAALRESEERYRTLFNSMDEGFCVIEFLDGPHGPLSDYVHIEANPAYTRHAGIPDVVGRRLREMVPAEADGWIALYSQVLRTGTPIHFERELATTGRQLELSAFRIEPPERRQVAVVFQDVTDRKRAAVALRRMNETLEARVAAALAERRILAHIVEGTNAFVQVMDRDFRWLAINGAAAAEFERLFGVRPEVGANMLDLLADRPGPQAALRKVWARALAGESFMEVVSVGEPARAYEMRFNTLHDPEGRQIGAYQFVYDVTERMQEQERLRQAEEALRQSQKMEAVGQLTGGIAHDFNNLLTGIIGALELLTNRLAQGRVGEVERYVLAAQGAARRAAALTHRLLAFSRRQTLDPKPTDVNRLVAGMEELVRRTVGPAIEVETVGAGRLWPVLVDPPQLENALLNLCINARDAMPRGGRLTIETANRWLDERAARDLSLAPGQYVSLCVSDTGTGMSREVKAKAFDPFFTTKPLGQGTGLGLSMIYGFTRQSGGQTRIYSEPGQGTMVCLYLPRHHGGAEAAEAAAAASPPPRAGAGETVLVVDDEPTVRMLVMEVLEELGYAAIEAGDGAAGLKLLQSEARIDLLVTDVGLPGGMNGRQMADAARVTRPGLKVLFITGYAENAVVGDGHLEPGMHVMTKPFAMQALAQRIRSLTADA